MQNEVVRLKTYSSQRTPASGLYKSLQILTLDDMIKLSLTTIAHTFHQKTVPKVFDELFKYVNFKISHGYDIRHLSNHSFF